MDVFGGTGECATAPVILTEVTLLWESSEATEVRLVAEGDLGLRTPSTLRTAFRIWPAEEEEERKKGVCRKRERERQACRECALCIESL